jgi:hypothetical protein
MTYAYNNDVDGILLYLDTMLRSPPDGFEYVAHTPIVASDSGPGGFRVRYKRGTGEITMCFLVLDMEQALQANAAKAAAVKKQ